jgi:hypothetical protein
MLREKNVYTHFVFAVVAVHVLAGDSSAEHPALQTLRAREEAMSCVAGKGVVSVEAPTGNGEQWSDSVDFLIAWDGRYRVKKTNKYGTTINCADGSADYEQTGANTLEIHPPDSSAGAVHIQSMLFPEKAIISPLFEKAESIRLVSEGTTDNTGAVSYSYVLEMPQDEQLYLLLVFKPTGELERICIRDNTSPLEMVHLFTDHVKDKAGATLPRNYQFFFQPIGSKRTATANRQVIVEIKLDMVESGAKAEGFAPVLEGMAITDYRKGLPWLKKSSDELVENLLDNIGL